DLVTFWHALEHVHDVNRYLRAVSDRLRKDGRVIIAAPNYESYDARHYRNLWAAYDVPRHLYHFHHSSMVALLERCGLSVVDLRSLPFDSFYVSILSEKKADGNLMRGLWVGLKSYLSSLSDTRTSSSLVYVGSTPAARS
ncbi:MAG: methyltransferase domain-containing protein, partial [Fidelibacterota bacterium]